VQGDCTRNNVRLKEEKKMSEKFPSGLPRVIELGTRAVVRKPGHEWDGMTVEVEPWSYIPGIPVNFVPPRFSAHLPGQEDVVCEFIPGELVEPNPDPMEDEIQRLSGVSPEFGEGVKSGE
jgi:hypothetical protein